MLTIIINYHSFNGTSRALTTATKASGIRREDFSPQTKRPVQVDLPIANNRNIGTDPVPLAAPHRKHQCGGERCVVNTRCGWENTGESIQYISAVIHTFHHNLEAEIWVIYLLEWRAWPCRSFTVIVWITHSCQRIHLPCSCMVEFNGMVDSWTDTGVFRLASAS